MQRNARHLNFNSYCRKVLIVSVASAMVICTGCLQRTGTSSPDVGNPNVGNQVKTQSVQPGPALPSPQTTPQTVGQQALIPYVHIHNATYVPADDLVKAVHLNGKWSDDKTTYMIGYTGVDMLLKPGSTSVTKGDQTVQLTSPPIESNQKLYITVQDAKSLFDDVANLKTGEANDGLVINPAEQKLPDQQTLDNDDSNMDVNSMDINSMHETSLGIASSSVAQRIIATGKSYMGRPYNFGARPGDTSSFDCSSFTQTIYGKYGIKLPRLAGQQARQGRYVARKNLKAGDLVFFYKRPHMHVGVYIGNGKILHTYGAPGVTITNLNKAWWSRNYTTGRRVI